MSTQEQLVDIGETLMRERGYGGFSFADLARETGIRKASVHHHFATKADFGIAVLIRYAERMRALLEMFANSRSGGQALYKLINLYREMLSDSEHLCLCVALAGDRTILSERMHAVLAQTNAATASWIESVLLTGRKDRSISVGGDPAEEAWAILAHLQGAQLLARAAGEVEQFDKALVTLMTRINRY
ncbi:TetR/AcrR family transcriptional regulator [Altererythrobacter lutimaris]|uniref:TetR/AcrR family transcriptional regulator n=1 Tax=Altererythrobacter lutimaris TaxID=2743979 RepID=A0A850H5Q6_9SPHN|nr:TetR/AcrR family transcriptional regulator [Altererythrobacter lutimaris]NVE94544.1 TetR/AcrR family transcriptional regulator [Altererythrobacter lutimaris]